MTVEVKDSLLISEIYLAICGEGSEIGLPAVFVRTSGCNLRCPGWPCDTPYTSVAPEGEWVSVEEVYHRVRSLGCRRVFLTGGEPLLWRKPLYSLLRQLKEEGYQSILQSNGTFYAPEIFALCDLISLDCKTPSSGEDACLSVIQKTLETFSPVQVKFVIADEGDYRFACEVYRQLSDQIGDCVNRVQWVLQPVDKVGLDTRETLLQRLQWLQERVLEDQQFQFRVLPQLHILVYGSSRRGV